MMLLDLNEIRSLICDYHRKKSIELGIRKNNCFITTRVRPYLITLTFGFPGDLLPVTITWTPNETRAQVIEAIHAVFQ